MQKILIADRDPLTREWYSDLVRRLGHLPLECEDGIAVLDSASAHTDLDLVIMDVDLPGAWGEQLICVMRGLDCLDEVPIIIASAPRSNTELMRLLSSGARRWFPRPPDEEDFVAAIVECLDRVAALSVFDVPEPVASVAVAEPHWLLG